MHTHVNLYLIQGKILMININIQGIIILMEYIQACYLYTIYSLHHINARTQGKPIEILGKRSPAGEDDFYVEMQTSDY
jgi:hypothetical protein